MICETWKDSEALSNHEKEAAFIKNIDVLKEFTTIKVENSNFEIGVVSEGFTFCEGLTCF